MASPMYCTHGNRIFSRRRAQRRRVRFVDRVQVIAPYGADVVDRDMDENANAPPNGTTAEIPEATERSSPPISAEASPQPSPPSTPLIFPVRDWTTPLLEVSMPPLPPLEGDEREAFFLPSPSPPIPDLPTQPDADSPPSPAMHGDEPQTTREPVRFGTFGPLIEVRSMLPPLPEDPAYIPSSPPFLIPVPPTQPDAGLPPGFVTYGDVPQTTGRAVDFGTFAPPSSPPGSESSGDTLIEIGDFRPRQTDGRPTLEEEDAAARTCMTVGMLVVFLLLMAVVYLVDFLAR
ncbi:hypothetical protein F4779DRAFT_330592 [Xylariaceae sp. FL0662B]|nr:hypothetical protein F4779DRAFT_330592 [Xylariaceae sp. FL0662B]